MNPSLKSLINKVYQTAQDCPWGSPYHADKPIGHPESKFQKSEAKFNVTQEGSMGFSWVCNPAWLSTSESWPQSSGFPEDVSFPHLEVTRQELNDQSRKMEEGFLHCGVLDLLSPFCRKDTKEKTLIFVRALIMYPVLWLMLYIISSFFPNNHFEWESAIIISIFLIRALKLRGEITFPRSLGR